MGRERFYGNDVPGLGGDYVGGEDVDFIGGVGLLGVVGVEVTGADQVSAFAEAVGGFDLHAPETAAGVEDEVVGLVADWL